MATTSRPLDWTSHSNTSKYWPDTDGTHLENSLRLAERVNSFSFWTTTKKKWSIINASKSSEMFNTSICVDAMCVSSEGNEETLDNRHSLSCYTGKSSSPSSSSARSKPIHRCISRSSVLANGRKGKRFDLKRSDQLNTCLICLSQPS